MQKCTHKAWVNEGNEILTKKEAPNILLRVKGGVGAMLTPVIPTTWEAGDHKDMHAHVCASSTCNHPKVERARRPTNRSRPNGGTATQWASSTMERYKLQTQATTQMGLQSL